MKTIEYMRLNVTHQSAINTNVTNKGQNNKAIVT